ncbi:MAG: OadG family protein [Gammaproteobacteria bacterium]|nr:OadG family protein [Gammaproteobacteria bacterium]
MNDGLVLMAVGMVVVFGALSLLLGAIMLLRRFGTEPVAPVRREQESKQSVEEAQPAKDHIDGQLIAILTAAATAALGARVRVYRVGFIGDETNEDQAWVRQVRSEHHTSHRRKKF